MKSAILCFTVRERPVPPKAADRSPIEYVCALATKTGKQIDTLVKYNVKTGIKEELQLETPVAKKGATAKLIEVRQEAAYVVDYQYVRKRRIDSSQSDSGMVEEAREIEYRKWPSIYIHGGYSMNSRTKKRTYSADLHYISTETGQVRKFFLFDAAKARGSHAMVKSPNDEVLFMYGGQGLKV